MMKRLLLLLASILAAGLSVAAEPYRIGLSLGITGKYAAIALHQMQGIQLWAREVNARGGLLGRPVTLVIHDDRGEEATAASLYERLIREDKVDFLLGPYSSPLSAEAARVAVAHGWPLLVTGGSADSLWEKGHKQIFGIYAPASQYQVGLFELMVDAGISRVAILHADDNFSVSAATAARTLADRYGITVAHMESFRKGTVDLAGPVTRAREARAEALVVDGHLDESVNARRAIKTAAWKPRLYYATVGPATDKYAEILKEDAENTFTSTLWEPVLRYPGSPAFNEGYRNAWNMSPSYQAALSYAGGQVLESAAKQANSLDRQKLAQVLQEMNVMTILGRYGVDATGKQIRQRSFIVQWRNGRREIVHPKPLATVAPVLR